MADGKTEAEYCCAEFVAVVILVPLVIVIVAFAVANRQIVTISFDPFER